MNQPREVAGNEWDTTAYDEDHSFVFEYGEASSISSNPRRASASSTSAAVPAT